MSNLERAAVALLIAILLPICLLGASYRIPPSGGTLETGDVTSDHILNGTIVAADVANDTLTATQIAANAIASSELADNAVDTGAIANNAVDGTKIALGSDVSQDIPVYNGTDYARFAVGAQGMVLRVSTAGALEYGGARSRRRFFEVLEDFIASPTQTDMGFGSSVSGTAAAITMSGTLADADHVGVLNCAGGSDTNSRCSVSLSTNQFAFSTARANELTYETGVQVSVVSDGTNTYQLTLGFGDTPASTSDPTDGIYFIYSSSINSAKWRCAASAAGATSTADDTGSAVAATTWYRLRATLSSGTLQCFVDDVQIGSNITTNIPTGANTSGIMSKIHKTAGTGNNPVLSVDYIYIMKAVSR